VRKASGVNRSAAGDYSAAAEGYSSSISRGAYYLR